MAIHPNLESRENFSSIHSSPFPQQALIRVSIPNKNRRVTGPSWFQLISIFLLLTTWTKTVTENLIFLISASPTSFSLLNVYIILPMLYIRTLLSILGHFSYFFLRSKIYHKAAVIIIPMIMYQYASIFNPFPFPQYTGQRKYPLYPQTGTCKFPQTQILCSRI